MAGKILIVEDDRAIAQSLTRLLSREGYYVSHQRTAEEAVALLAQTPAYDLALLDVMLPGMDGFACCRALRAQGWHAPIIMLTGRSAAAYRVSGLDAGADDYIGKPFDPAELLARIRAQMRRALDYASAQTDSQGLVLGPDLVLDTGSRDVLRAGHPLHLTEREFELLALLARRPGVVQEKLWLFQQIWGGASELGIKVLAVYMRRLRRKIELDMDHPQILLTVRGYGYKLAAPDAPLDGPLDNAPPPIVR